MTKKIKTDKQQAEEHWAYIEAILAKRQEEEKHLFIDAFIHGLKHGRQSKK